MMLLVSVTIFPLWGKIDHATTEDSAELQGKQWELALDWLEEPKPIRELPMNPGAVNRERENGVIAAASSDGGAREAALLQIHDMGVIALRASEADRQALSQRMPATQPHLASHVTRFWCVSESTGLTELAHCDSLSIHVEASPQLQSRVCIAESTADPDSAEATATGVNEEQSNLESATWWDDSVGRPGEILILLSLVSKQILYWEQWDRRFYEVRAVADRAATESVSTWKSLRDLEAELRTAGRKAVSREVEESQFGMLKQAFDTQEMRSHSQDLQGFQSAVENLDRNFDTWLDIKTPRAWSPTHKWAELRHERSKIVTELKDVRLQLEEIARNYGNQQHASAEIERIQRGRLDGQRVMYAGIQAAFVAVLSLVIGVGQVAQAFEWTGAQVLAAAVGVVVVSVLVYSVPSIVSARRGRGSQ